MDYREREVGEKWKDDGQGSTQLTLLTLKLALKMDGAMSQEMQATSRS